MKFIREKKWYKNYTRKDYEIYLPEIDGKLLKFNHTYIRGEFLTDIIIDQDIDDEHVSMEIEHPAKPFSGPIIIRTIQEKKLRIVYLIAEYGRNTSEIESCYYEKLDMIPVE